MSGIEILGIAASVLQIAELGGKLSVKLFTFSRKIKNANKDIDSVSQDIAATGAVLQQLGNELTKDEKTQLCSSEAVATAQQLVEDCRKIFHELNGALDGGKGQSRNASHQLIMGWKERLKYPFLEPQIELLRSNLERLKSSLVVMLNVLIYAEQLKNREALPLLRDQRELIKTLVDDKNASEKRFAQITQSIEGLHITPAAPEYSEKPDISQNVSNLMTVNAIAMATGQRNLSSAREVNSEPDNLPPGLAYRKEEIDHHCTLVNSLIREISAVQYKIDHGLRHNMHQGVLGVHWNEWSKLRKTYDDEHLLKIFSPHGDVVRFWMSRLEEESLHSKMQQHQQQQHQMMQAQQQHQMVQAQQQMAMPQMQQMPPPSIQEMLQRQREQTLPAQQRLGIQRTPQISLPPHQLSPAAAAVAAQASNPPQQMQPSIYQQAQLPQSRAPTGNAEPLRIPQEETLARQRQFWQARQMQVQQVQAHAHNQASMHQDLRTNADQMSSHPIPESLKPYELQMKMLEFQNKKRLGLIPQDSVFEVPPDIDPSIRQSIANSAQSMPEMPKTDSTALQNYQMQLMLLEQQNKKRLMMASQDQEETPRMEPLGNLPPATDHPSRALQDHLMQLMLMEQQNKKRLMMARQEQAESARLDQQSDMLHPSDDYPHDSPAKRQKVKYHGVDEGLLDEAIPLAEHYGPGSSDAQYNLNFSSVEADDVLNDFDFDSFLNNEKPADAGALEEGALPSVSAVPLQPSHSEEEPDAMSNQERRFVHVNMNSRVNWAMGLLSVEEDLRKLPVEHADEDLGVRDGRSPTLRPSNSKEPHRHQSSPARNHSPAGSARSSSSTIGSEIAYQRDAEVGGTSSDICPLPGCGHRFQDLKAHMLTHQSQRSKKCPVPTCEYNKKGFDRKYDKNRHILTHFKGTMVCGFCPSLSASIERTFNRVDVFKRHLVGVHGATPFLSSRPDEPVRVASTPTRDIPRCSNCSISFNEIQAFYDHLDDCVLRIIQQQSKEQLSGPAMSAFGGAQLLEFDDVEDEEDDEDDEIAEECLEAYESEDRTRTQQRRTAELLEYANGAAKSISRSRRSTALRARLFSKEKRGGSGPEPFGGLKGLVVVEDGLVKDGDGNIVGRVVEGEMEEVVGKSVNEAGEVVDEDGYDTWGRCETFEEPEEELGRSFGPATRPASLPRPVSSWSHNSPATPRKMWETEFHGEEVAESAEMQQRETEPEDEEMEEDEGARVSEWTLDDEEMSLGEEAASGPRGLSKDPGMQGTFAGLGPLVVNSNSYVTDWDGHVFGRLVEGQPMDVCGKSVNEDGEVVDEKRGLVGKFERCEYPEEEERIQREAFGDVSEGIEEKEAELGVDVRKRAALAFHVNTTGDVPNKTGDVIAKLVEGNLRECVGIRVSCYEPDGTASVLDEAGRWVGKVALLPELEGDGPDALHRDHMWTIGKGHDDQVSPVGLASGGTEFRGKAHDPLSDVQNQVSYKRRGLMPLHLPPHVGRKSRSRGGPGQAIVADDQVTPGSDEGDEMDWSKVNDPSERRRIQNRVAARKFRESRKRLVETGKYEETWSARDVVDELLEQWTTLSTAEMADAREDGVETAWNVNQRR